MALDEPRDTDQQFDVDGYTYIIDKDFLEKAKPIKVDFMIHGFKLDCGLDFSAAGCNSCGTTGSCCS